MDFDTYEINKQHEFWQKVVQYNMADSQICGSMSETNFDEGKSLFDASIQS